MSTHHLIHIPSYEGEDDPRRHWFVCERMWDASDITNDDKKIAQLAGALRKRELTWYMNLIENQERTKDEIKTKFLAFFKIEDVAHLASQKLKDIKKILGEIVQEYEKIFKYLCSQIPYKIYSNLLVQ